MVLKGLKSVKERLFGGVPLPTPLPESMEDEFIELSSEPLEKGTTKIMLKCFSLNDFSDVKPVIDDLREGFSICLVKIKPLFDKDKIELKRAISKLKKTAVVLDGDVVGIDENWIVAVPSYVRVFKGETNTPELLE